MALKNNYPLNQTVFKIVRGVQNEVLFFVRDLDSNPANTTTFQHVTVNIVDPESSTLLMTRALTVVDAPSALYMLTILASETATWETGSLRWSITITRSDGSTVMLWTDKNYGPYSTLEVCEGPDPTVSAALILDPSSFVINTNIAYSSNLPGAAKLGYQNGIQTFAVYPNNFTGSLEVDGSLVSQPSNSGDWFPISTTNYSSASSLSTIDVVGNYLWLRILMTTTSGSINQILYKN